jgi:acyl-CoA synthetase (AMP-forming)/AMP-acid ligase II
MNLTMLLDMAVDGFSDRKVVGRNSDGLTARQLKSMSIAGAGVVHEAGADAIVYLAINGPAFPVALFAAAQAGVPLIPVNYRLGEAQLAALLSKHPKALGIGGGETELAALRKAGMTVLDTSAWLDRVSEASDDEQEPRDTGAPAVIIYTSGTTAAPKGVLLRHENLTSYVFGSVEFASAEPADAALVSVPPYHIAAVANVISNLFAGRRTLVLEQFTPAQWLQLARDEGVTNALVVPTMLARIVEAELGDGDKKVPTLRNLAYGGAPMPLSVIERALHMWPEVGFVNAYGLTETSSTISVLGPDDHRAALNSGSPAIRARLASAGQILPGIDIEIRNGDGTLAPPGVVGRICVRGEQVSAEYAGIGRAVDEHGFFDTRDSGYLDESGYLFIGGRVDDTIIRGAENIAPAEIEEVLFGHPAVTDVAVVGVPDEEWGQRIEAAVVIRPGEEVDERELRDLVRGVLRSSKTPDRIVFVDELPRTETGKLVRRHVVDKLAADHVSSASKS